MTSSRTLLLIAGLTLAGCHAAPVGETAFGPAQVRVERAGEARLGNYVAITEFSVESVDTKSRYPGPGAMAFDPATLAPPLHVLGVGARLTQFPKGLRGELPTLLFEELKSAFGEAQIEVVAFERVVASSAYADYGPEPFVRSSYLRHLDPRGTDTGRPRRSRIYAAEGLEVATSLEGIDVVDRRIGEQLLSDSVLRVRLRIGSHEGHATLESGSTLTLTTPSGSLTASLDHTILSSDRVAEPSCYVPFRGFLDEVEREPYRAAIRRLARRFALYALQGTHSHPGGIESCPTPHAWELKELPAVEESSPSRENPSRPRRRTTS